MDIKAQLLASRRGDNSVTPSGLRHLTRTEYTGGDDEELQNKSNYRLQQV